MMIPEAGVTLTQVISGFSALIALMIGGLAVRKRMSKDKVEHAQDDADTALAVTTGNWFTKALKGVEHDRDLWRATAEDAYRKLRVAELKAELAERDLKHERANARLANRLIALHPDLAAHFRRSEPGEFDPTPMPSVLDFEDTRPSPQRTRP